MFDREIEYRQASIAVKVSMILSNYYCPPEDDFVPKLCVDPLEIVFYDDHIFDWATYRSIRYKKSQLEEMRKFLAKQAKIIEKNEERRKNSLQRFFTQK